MKTKQTIQPILMALLVLILASNVFGALKLDNIQFDPQIIAAGDEVDIVIQFHDDSVLLSNDNSKVSNNDYRFEVFLKPDDTISEQFITIQDAQGDDVIGSVIFSNELFYKKFRVKVSPEAPSGSYELKLEGQWFKNGEPEESKESLTFKLPVKKEGIIIGLTSYDTIPAEVRPGDNFVKIKGYIDNTGHKAAKSIQVELDLPNGIESSYANNNRVWVGSLDVSESKETNFFVNLDQDIPPGLYELNYTISYSDLDDNKYQKDQTLPFLVKTRPNLEVIESIGEGLAGDYATLTVKVKNIGSEDAESIDVRLLKENSQPFTLDVRSDYIGELKPGEEGIAIFNLKVLPSAEIKEHDFKILIRAKGDSDEGDDNIYTFNRRAKLDITGVKPNNLKTYGLLGGSLVLLFIIGNIVFKQKSKKTTSRRK